jgi:DNA/RNA-binding domain of Phe-tRNA-synthetase-like protein
MQLETTDAWRSAFPDAHVGIVVVDGLNYRSRADALDLQLAELEAKSRRRYAGFDRVRLTELRLMRDGVGIISAVLNGPDLRTRLTESSRRGLFVTYAPAGIDPHDVQRHLDEIARYVSLASPGAIVSQVEVI